MAHLDNNSVLENGTCFRVGSWIFIADGSGSFESCSIDQSLPEVPEAASHHEFDDFIDQLEEVGFSTLNNETRIQPEFDAFKTKTLSELEEDLERLLEDTKQETPTDGKVLPSSCIHSTEPNLQKKNSKTSFKKTTRRKKPSKDTFSNIDDIDKNIEYCLQLAEDTYNDKTSYEEFSNPWALSSVELEQDQAFIKHLEELDELISKDELAEWSNNIDLFMKGLINPDKLKTLWEQSKAKKLWDDSQNKTSAKIGSVLIRISPHRRLCFNRRLHESLVQRHSNSKFTYSTRKTPHATAILSGRMWQFRQVQ